MSFEGAGKTHSKLTDLRNAVRQIIDKQLGTYLITCQLLRVTDRGCAAEVTGVSGLTMKWKTYWESIVTTHRVQIEGWPSKIEFAPLTQACSGIGDTERLLKSWENGDTYWRKLTEDQYAKQKQLRETRTEGSEIEVDRSRKTRSDKGKKRGKCTSHSSAMKIVSQEFVDSSDDEDGHPENNDNDQNNLAESLRDPRVKRRCREHEAPISDNISALSSTASTRAGSPDQISMPLTSLSLIATPSCSTTSLLEPPNPNFDAQATNVEQQLLDWQGNIQLTAGESRHSFIIIICNFYTGASRKAPHTATDDFDISGLNTNPFLSYDFTEQLTSGLNVLDTANGPLSLLSPTGRYSLPQL